MSEWYPIETAPKDGTYIIVWPSTWPGAISCAYWPEDADYPYWERTDAFGAHFTHKLQPTHWMRRPNPPEESK